MFSLLFQVELLFKKLEGLPDNVKQSVFSKIQEKLPSQGQCLLLYNLYIIFAKIYYRFIELLYTVYIIFVCIISDNQNDVKSEGKVKSKIGSEKTCNLNIEDVHGNQGMFTFYKIVSNALFYDSNKKTRT